MKMSCTRAVAGLLMRLGLACTAVLAVAPSMALPVAPGWLASAQAQQAYGLVPQTLMTLLPANQVRRESVVDLSGTPAAPTSPGSATAQVSAPFGQGWAWGGELRNAQGQLEPALKASTVAQYTGAPESDGHARSQGASGLMDTIRIESATLPMGTPVSIPLMLMMHGSIDPPTGDMGGPAGYYKRFDNTAEAAISSRLLLTEVNGANLLSLDTSRSFRDGYACGSRSQPEPCSFVVTPDTIGAAEECFPSGCFTVGSQPGTVDAVFVVKLLSTHVGDLLDLYASAAALVDHTESASFGQVGGDLSSTVHFGFMSLPAGVSIGSALGLNYAFDPVSYVRLITGDNGGGGGNVPAPSTALLVLPALLAAARRRRPGAPAGSA